jgi:ubiquitin C-terminal hydrolase
MSIDANSVAGERVIPMSDAMKRMYGCVARWRSGVTDVFDGRCVSTVKCGTCQHVSTTVETFQVGVGY